MLPTLILTILKEFFWDQGHWPPPGNGEKGTSSLLPPIYGLGNMEWDPETVFSQHFQGVLMSAKARDHCSYYLHLLIEFSQLSELVLRQFPFDR